jgi:hypothetical protein
MVGIVTGISLLASSGAGIFSLGNGVRDLIGVNKW